VNRKSTHTTRARLLVEPPRAAVSGAVTQSSLVGCRFGLLRFCPCTPEPEEEEEEESEELELEPRRLRFATYSTNTNTDKHKQHQ
jgi:hypothetical protein